MGIGDTGTDAALTGLLLAGAELAWALACIAQDLRSRRIGNRMLLPGLVLAGLAVLLGQGPEGEDLARGLVAALALLPAWKLGVLGGGDVKLAAVLALLGPAELPVALAAGLVGVVAVGLARRAAGRGPGLQGETRRRLPFAPFLLLPWLALRLLG